MTKLLLIDTSPRLERSASRELGQHFVAAWSERHGPVEIIRRDIGVNPPPAVTEDWIVGAYAPSTVHTAAAQASIAVSNLLVDEVIAADRIVVSTPIYNFSVPSALKAYIDQIVRIGATFAPATGGPRPFRPLLSGKKIVFFISAGADYSPGTYAAQNNFMEPYLRAIFDFIGISDSRFIYVHNTAADESVRTANREAAAAKARALALDW